MRDPGCLARSECYWQEYWWIWIFLDRHGIEILDTIQDTAWWNPDRHLNVYFISDQNMDGSWPSRQSLASYLCGKKVQIESRHSPDILTIGQTYQDLDPSGWVSNVFQEELLDVWGGLEVPDKLPGGYVSSIMLISKSRKDHWPDNYISRSYLWITVDTNTLDSYGMRNGIQLD